MVQVLHPTVLKLNPGINPEAKVMLIEKSMGVLNYLFLKSLSNSFRDFDSLEKQLESLTESVYFFQLHSAYKVVYFPNRAKLIHATVTSKLDLHNML